MPAPTALTELEPIGEADLKFFRYAERFGGLLVMATDSDAAIDHVDALRSLRRAHIDDVVHDIEVRPLDEFDAHLVGEEGMLVIGAVVDAGREHHHGGFARAIARRDGGERAHQFVAIVVDRRHVVAREEIGEEPHRDLAVLQHVGDAGGRAAIVFQHVEFFRPDTHHVDARDMREDVVGNGYALHLVAVGVVQDHLVARHDTGLEDFLSAIDIGDEGVERPDTLDEPVGYLSPLGGFENAGNDVEGDDAFRIATLAIDGKGDADAAEEGFGFLAPERQYFRRRLAEPCLQGLCKPGGSRRPVRPFRRRWPAPSSLLTVSRFFTS